MKQNGNQPMTECCCREPTATATPCCRPPERSERWIRNWVDTDAGAVPVVETAWGREETVGRLRCRISSSFRMRYAVEPGLYAVGSPGKDSPVFVSANYKLSFDILRRDLAGLDGWVLVLDTKGINVWCAAGKGTFGTRELIERIIAVRLDKVVDHRKLVVPQLGAPGIKAHYVRKSTGFRVYYGPVLARDIRTYLGAGYRAGESMRRVPFGLVDRLVLTPMELSIAFRDGWKYALAIVLLFGLGPKGFLFADMLEAWPFLVAGLGAVISGAFLTPALLPVVPVRSFALKGLALGLIATALATVGMQTTSLGNPYLLVSAWALFPALSSYLGYNFTGCTTFTNPSGVKRELQIALPYYVGGAVVAGAGLVLYKLNVWGII